MTEPAGLARQPLGVPDDRWSLFYGDRLLPLFVGLLPVVAMAVPRALVVLLVAAGVLALPTLFRREEPRWLAWLRLIAGRDPALLLWLILATVWMLIASLWSPAIGGALALCARLAGMAFCGLVLLAVTDRLDPPRRNRAASALVIGVAVALVIGHVIWLSFWLPQIRQNFRLPYDQLFDLNRGVAVLAVLAWPTIYVLCRRERWLGAGVLALAYIHLLARTESLSAKVAAAAALLTIVLVAAWPRIVPLIIAGMVATSVLLLPWAFSHLPPPDQFIQAFPQLFPSSQHRLYIWQFALERIGEHPWLGWGLDASRNLPGGKIRPPVGLEMMPLHPHNNLLQVRLELGLMGAAIMAAMLARSWSLVARQPGRAAAAVHAAMLAGYLAVGMFGYGMWQSWWIAVAWLCWSVGRMMLPATPAGAPLMPDLPHLGGVRRAQAPAPQAGQPPEQPQGKLSPEPPK